MYPHLFRPLQLGRKTMRNRIVHAPMSVCYANPAGEATPAMVEHYARRAQGGAGMVIIENVAVGQGGRQMPRQPMLHDEAALPGFKLLAAAIRHHGALAVMQIVHAGRYAGPWEDYDTGHHLAPSALPFSLAGKQVTPHEMTPEDISTVCDAFARTARLAIEAGFDGVQIHGATGFLITQFMSPRMNRRQDEYGGSIENRCRFGLRVLGATRAAIGPDAIVGMQLFSEELHPDGATLADAIFFARQLEASGCDFVMPVCGTFETLRLPEHAGMNRRPAYQLEQATRIKQAVGMPVFANGGLGDPELAERILRLGEADAIGLARPLFTDPDWPHKVRTGLVDEIRVCGCEGNTCFRTQLTGGICEKWPAAAVARGFLGFEAEPMTDRDRRARPCEPCC